MPHVENYEDFHLTEAMADKAITWMRRHLAMNPDRPFLMWWTPGAVHGPHHVAKEVGRQVQGQVRRRLGRLPGAGLRAAEGDGLDPGRHEASPASGRHARLGGHPRDDERAFQARLMEVYAGFLEHTDVQVGKLIDELEARGIRDNTLVIYILSDNGASAEGIDGSVAELNAQNGIPSTVAEHIAVARAARRTRRDRRAQDGQHVPRRLGLGRRQPLPLHEAGRLRLGRHAHAHGHLVAEAHQAPDKTPRPQFTHVNDVVPTIYEILGIRPPKVVDGHEQDPIDGVSFAYTFDSADAPERKKTQYFDCLGSRGIYHEGWMASTFGPRKPWVAALPDLASWDPMQDSGSCSTRAATTR
jgi:arylsulfatase A-like enzyme